MKKFTIMAFMTFPLVLFVSLFAMGADSTPIIGQKHDFWIIIGLIAVAAASMLQYFKRKKWF
jgi:Mg2+ and Co2+ transporter CorA